MSKETDLFEFAMRGARAQATANELLQKFKKHGYGTMPLTITITEHDLMELLGQVVGAASMCWKPKPSKATFDSDTAKYIVDSAFHALTKAQP